MKNFRQFNEDASDKLSGMDDKQVADLKKNNPGAAAKIDQLRKKRAAASSSAPAPSSAPKLKTSAIVKPSAIVKSDKTPSGADTARMKARQSQMGKFAQGIKNAPKPSTQVPAKGGAMTKNSGGALAKTGKTQAEKEGPGRQGTYRGDGQTKGAGPDKAYGGRPYPKEQKPSDEFTKKKEKEKKDAEKKAEDELTRKQSMRDNGIMGTIKSRLGGDRFTRDRDDDTEATKAAKDAKRQAASKRMGNRIANAPGKVVGGVAGAIKGIGRAAAKTKTSGSVGSEGGDGMETLQRNSY